MTAQLSVTVDQARLRAIQRALKDAGDRKVTTAFNRSLRDAAQPVARAEQEAARALPASGPVVTGLRSGIADHVRVTVTRSQRNPGVRISSRALLAKASASRGWRHPVFGNRATWVREVLAPGWFARTASARKAEITTRIRQAMDKVKIGV